MPSETDRELTMTQRMVLGTQLSVLGLAALHVGLDWVALALIALGVVATVGSFMTRTAHTP
ncbi:hypothetical protein [Salarchaeum japonicum]|uniref:Uncharacterized protein n=1 Tax=Salarchaeum japonicum TaxID=555573 RepID=A0AAV3T186_9EURY|nr:hypothetical protein [Salarchaeum japonicum]